MGASTEAKYLSLYACPVCGAGVSTPHTKKVGLAHTVARAAAKRHVEGTGHGVLVTLRGPAGVDEFTLAPCEAAPGCKLAGELLDAAGNGACFEHVNLVIDRGRSDRALKNEGSSRASERKLGTRITTRRTVATELAGDKGRTAPSRVDDLAGYFDDAEPVYAKCRAGCGRLVSDDDESGFCSSACQDEYRFEADARAAADARFDMAAEGEC